MIDRERLAKARSLVLEAKTNVGLVAYGNGTYHAIKYSVDAARDLLLQAEMTIDTAIAALSVDQVPDAERNT